MEHVSIVVVISASAQSLGDSGNQVQVCWQLPDLHLEYEREISGETEIPVPKRDNTTILEPSLYHRPHGSFVGFTY